MSAKITVKKNLIIFHNKADWKPIRQRLKEEYGTSVLINYVMLNKLGFTPRIHTQWITRQDDEGYIHKYPEEQMHLDFYSESAQTWFQLRYLNR